MAEIFNISFRSSEVRLGRWPINVANLSREKGTEERNGSGLFDGCSANGPGSSFTRIGHRSVVAAVRLSRFHGMTEKCYLRKLGGGPGPERGRIKIARNCRLRLGPLSHEFVARGASDSPPFFSRYPAVLLLHASNSAIGPFDFEKRILRRSHF